MDLSQLAPAPWKLWSPYSETCREVVDANGKRIAVFNNHDEAVQAILARNAFDVMMRRGWTVKRHPDGRWYVDVPLRIPHDGGTMRRFADDPFTALIESDQWYAANVENRADCGCEVTKGYRCPVHSCP